MTDTIKTVSVSKNFAKADDILLDETPQTALFFSPDLSSAGVRGRLIRYKKGQDEKWEAMPKKDFRRLKIYEGVYIELNTKAAQTLYDKLQKLYAIPSGEGQLRGRKEFVVSEIDASVNITDSNKMNVINQILNKEYTKDFWKIFEDTSPDLLDNLIAGRMQVQRKKVLEELRQRLTERHHETKGDNSWQKWIYENNWLFGAAYKTPIQQQKLNLKGIMPDYLFPTHDDYMDILEIKLPNADVIKMDPSHKGSWVWSREVCSAIGQVVTYISAIEENRPQIEKSIKEEYMTDIFMLKPRAFILIGTTEGWSQDQRDGLRRLNHSLHNIEVITYSELMKRGEAFVNPT